MSRNHHDIFVRQIFSSREDSIEFFRVTLPNPVLKIMDIENLHDTKETFISEDQRELRTDLLYKIALKSGGSIYTYILFEHKSYLDPRIYTQLLRYLAEIYEWQKENEKKYSPIIPFVFYHGERGWNLGREFLDVFQLTTEEEILKDYIPNFKVNLYEMKSDDPDFPTNLLSLKLMLRILQHIRDAPELFGQVLRQTMRELGKEEPPEKRVALLKAILYYLDRARVDSEKYLKAEYYIGIEEEFMTALEKIEARGMEKGLQKGLQKGKLEGKLEDARLMKEYGDPIDKILKITGLTENQLRENGIL